MPRHPPCALKNLTTKDQGVISREPQKPTPHPKRCTARSRFIFLEIASYTRCSRPLCSSQTTTPYHTPHTHPPKTGNHAISAARKPETNKPPGTGQNPPPKALLPQDPTVCQTLNHANPRPRRSRTGPPQGNPDRTEPG